MWDQVANLKELLANEQEERRAERQERENYQQTVMVPQGDMKQLRQQLLGPSDQSPSFGVANPVAGPEVSADFTETTIRPEKVANTGSSGRAFGMIALVVLAAGALVAITNSELPLRENIAST